MKNKMQHLKNQDLKTLGLSLLELLVALAVMSILVVAFLNVFSGTLRDSNEITSRSKLLGEGRNALQLMAARVREACYIYETGNLNMGNGWTSSKNLGSNASSNTWAVDQDPIVAMIVPPRAGETNYEFFAYYPMQRDFYNTNASPTTRLDKRIDDTQTWVLMEYRRQLPTAATTQGQQCSQWAGNQRNFAGASGRLLIDGVQPSQNNYNVLSVQAANATTVASATMELRLEQNLNGKFIRVVDPTNLHLVAFPRNLKATQLNP